MANYPRNAVACARERGSLCPGMAQHPGTPHVMMANGAKRPAGGSPGSPERNSILEL